MIADILLAWLHHLCLIGMAASLAMQWIALGGPLDRARLGRLGRIDMAYGLLAMAILAIGSARVAYGPKGADFYLDNPVFWAKMAVFLAVGLISAVPTIAYARWRRQARSEASLAPAATEVAKIKRLVMLQAAGWIALPALAAAMARGIGLE